jgi:hypothetical protein
MMAIAILGEEPVDMHQSFQKYDTTAVDHGNLTASTAHRRRRPSDQIKIGQQYRPNPTSRKPASPE